MDGRESKQAPSLTIAGVLVLATLIASAIASYRATARVVANERLVAHTLRVIAELKTTISLLTDAETAQRGFLLTQDSSYLPPYNQAVAEMPPHLQTLASLTGDHEAQRQRVATLRQLTAERLAILKNTIELEQRGNHAAAMQDVLTGAGREKMAEVRGMFDDMIAEEHRLLEERSEDSQRSARQAIVTFGIASLAAVFLVMVFYGVARREVRKRAETVRRIAEREAWLSTTLRSIGDAVIATDEHGAVKFLNAVAEQLTGYSGQEAVGRPVAEIFHVENAATHTAAENPVDTVIRMGNIAALSDSVVMLDRNRREIPIEDSAAPIMGEGNNVLGVVLVFRDVSQRRQMQESARKAEKLAAAGRLAATIAHEINNPLEAITNLIYLARTGDSPETIQAYLGAVDRELSRVAHIARQTLGFYRDSAEPVTLKISSLLDEVLAVYASRINAKQIKVEKDYQNDVAIKMLRGEMLQILSNLIANALDAVPQHGDLRLRSAAREEGVEFSIEDNGTGIPAQNLGRIFDAFYTTKIDVGTGLGLWVVKDLLEKQGGTISVESSTTGADRGTRFVAFVPSTDSKGSARLTKAS